MKFTLITTIIFAAVLSVFLFVPVLAEAFEETFGVAGHIAPIEQQFLRLGILTGIYFVLVYTSIKLREMEYDKYNE